MLLKYFILIAYFFINIHKIDGFLINKIVFYKTIIIE